MALSAVRNWFGKPATFSIPPRGPGARVEPVLVVSDTPPEVVAPPLLWSPERLAITDTLWGEGYQSPGGEIETLRLAKPLGLSAASSLLLLGAGGGGASCSLATKLGVWVSGFEADTGLAAAGVEWIARKNLTKRAPLEVWNPGEPALRQQFYHHGLAQEPLRGSLPEPALAAIQAALKPGGQLMMSELVADTPLNPADPIVSHWARLERRDPERLPSEVAITRILGRLGFDVRVVEDVSERHIHQTMTGWRAAVRTMEAARPSRRQAMTYVREAELWLFRLRLFQMGRLRMIRWHAIGGA